MNKNDKLVLFPAIGVLSVGIAIAIFSHSPDNSTNATPIKKSPSQNLNSTGVKSGQPEGPLKDVTSYRVKPESIVMFPNSTIACFSVSNLYKVLQHYINGEHTKMKSYMYNKDNPDADCYVVPSDKRFKVLSAIYADDKTTETGVLEIVTEDISAAKNGAYAFVLSHELVKVVKQP